MSNASDFVIKNGVLKEYVGPGGDVVIPDSVTTIGDSAFEGCTGLTAITLPDGVTTIGYSAFVLCANITIHAPAGSYAEKYTKKNNIPFVAE